VDEELIERKRWCLNMCIMVYGLFDKICNVFHSLTSVTPIKRIHISIPTSKNNYVMDPSIPFVSNKFLIW
jgi:hypothetical protein